MIWFRLASLVLMVSLLGGLYFHYTYTINENKRLKVELTQANKTVKALDNIVARHNAIEAEEDILIMIIENEPEERDAPTAPVLIDAINRL